MAVLTLSKKSASAKPACGKRLVQFSFSPNFANRAGGVSWSQEEAMNCDLECPGPVTLNEKFRTFSVCVSKFAGTPIAFTISFIVIILWAVLGPVFRFSDSWQLVINTGTTIITFLMVFLIQNMQNRDAKAIHLKLDELIRALKGARNGLVNLESLSEAEMAVLEAQFAKLGERHRTQKTNTTAQAAPQVSVA